MRLLTITAALVVLAQPAHALNTDARGELDDDGIGVGLSLTSPGGDASPPAESSSLVHYSSHREWLPTPAAHTGSLDGLCSADGQPGFMWRLVGIAADGTIVDARYICMPFDPDDPTPTPPPLPEPPTVAEAWNAANLPAPAITTDPPTRGITGLETRISTTGPTTITIDATIRGYRIVGTATLDHYTIRVDDGPTEPADHSTYTFETKGTHTIEISAVWHGTATLTGPDLPTPIHLTDIGTATITATRQYPVHEIRTELTR